MTTTLTAPPPDPFRRGDWIDDAACAPATVDSELFFGVLNGPRGVEQDNAAKAVCAACSVRPQCLTWALLALPHGVAGGLTANERSDLRAKRRRAA